MRTLILTGIANEVSFTEGESSYFLVFNEGELRLPVEEGVAAYAVEVMMAEPQESEKDDPHAGETVQAPSNGQSHEEGAEYYSADDDDYDQPPDYRDPDEGVEDVEDGVGQF